MKPKKDKKLNSIPNSVGISSGLIKPDIDIEVLNFRRPKIKIIVI
jgi:hypothetical protein